MELVVTDGTRLNFENWSPKWHLMIKAQTKTAENSSRHVGDLRQ